MDIVAVRQAIEVLSPLLNANQIGQLEAMVGQGIIDYHEAQAEGRYKNDLNQLNIDMKLDVNASDFEDNPF